MWLQAAAWLALGTQCVACDRPGRPWCQECDEDLQVCVQPRVCGPQPLVVCCDYAGCVPDAVVGFKDFGVRQLRVPLGQVLAAGVGELLEFGLSGAALVPVPSSPAAQRRRGFDHVRDIASVAGDLLDMPMVPLLRSRRRADAARLGFADRRANVEATMRVAQPGTTPVIVVDDVSTSGATLQEASRALLAGGHPVVGQVVIASSKWGDPGVQRQALKG